jgi:hypothetical protein
MGFGPSGLSLGPGKATFPMSLVIAGGGAALAFLGWMLGLLFTSTTYAIGYGYGSYSVSWYGPSGAQGVGILAVLIAVASVALVFVNNTPSMKIVWPVPFHVILLVVSGVGALFGLLGLFFALTFGTGVGVDMGKPITLLLAAGAVFAGGVVQTVAAYMEYAAKSKKPV